MGDRCSMFSRFGRFGPETSSWSKRIVFDSGCGIRYAFIMTGPGLASVQTDSSISLFGNDRSSRGFGSTCAKTLHATDSSLDEFVCSLISYLLPYQIQISSINMHAPPNDPEQKQSSYNGYLLGSYLMCCP